MPCCEMKNILIFHKKLLYVSIFLCSFVNYLESTTKIMKPKVLAKKVTLKDFPLEFLRTINGTLGLTKGELTLTAAILEKYMEFGRQGLKEPFLSKFVFSTDGRKKLCEITGNLSNQNFGNKLKELVDKGVLVSSNSGYAIRSSLLPSTEVTFKFIITDEDTGQAVP